MVDHNTDDIETLKAKLDKAERSSHTYRQLATKLQKKLEEMEGAVEQKINSEVDQFRRSAKEAWRSAEEETARLDDELTQVKANLAKEKEKRVAAERTVERLNNDLKDKERSAAAEIRAAQGGGAGGADTQLMTKQIEKLRRENAQLHANLKKATGAAPSTKGYDEHDYNTPENTYPDAPSDELEEDTFDIALPGEITLHDPEPVVTKTSPPPKGPSIDTGKPKTSTLDKLSDAEQARQASNSSHEDDDDFDDAARQIFSEPTQSSSSFVEYNSALPLSSNQRDNKKWIMGGGAAAAVIAVVLIGMVFTGGDDAPVPIATTPEVAVQPEPAKIPEPVAEKPAPQVEAATNTPEPQSSETATEESTPPVAIGQIQQPEESQETQEATTESPSASTTEEEITNTPQPESDAATEQSTDSTVPQPEATAPAAPVLTVEEEQQQLEQQLREQAEQELARLMAERNQATEPESSTPETQATNNDAQTTPEDNPKPALQPQESAE